MKIWMKRKVLFFFLIKHLKMIVILRIQILEKND